MSKLNWRITPVNGYDIPALEGWLERMASKGLLFSMTLGPLTLFDREEPARLRFHLEPAREKTDQEDPELNALYDQAGWRYLGIFRKNYFVFATQEEQAQAHTDPATLEYALRRFFRQKLLGGLGLLLGNLLLLKFFWPSVPVYGLWRSLYWFPVETVFGYGLIPFGLSFLGLALADLSYLLGLVRLRRYRRAVRAGRAPVRGGRGGGWLLAAGILLLLPVGAQSLTYFLGMDYTPYPLKDSGFVTLTEIEGPDFRLSGDYFYSMDRISHGDTPLEPEYWYLRQCGAFSHYDGGIDLNDVPRLEIRITRYLLPVLAKQRMEEESRTRWDGAEYRVLPPPSGADRAMLSQSQGDESRLPHTHLLLQRGGTVLLAEYWGDKDLTAYLGRFTEMLEGL